MRGFFAICKRELFTSFVTPLAWVLIAAFLIVQGLHFFLIVTHFANDAAASTEGTPLEAFFGQTMLLYLPLLFICPLLTMRLFAEERRSGTIEALMTAPVGASAVVLAKFTAALLTYVAMWLPTVLYAVLVAQNGDVDWRTVETSYLAIFLVGAGYLAIGTMASALTKSQLIAAAVTSMILIALFIVGMGEFVFDDGPVHSFCSYLSLWSQMNDFSKGIIDTRRLVLNFTFVALPLFITTRAVEAWRWS